MLFPAWTDVRGVTKLGSIHSYTLSSILLHGDGWAGCGLDGSVRSEGGTGLVDLTVSVGKSFNAGECASDTGLDLPLVVHFLKPSIVPEWEKRESSSGSWKRDWHLKSGQAVVQQFMCKVTGESPLESAVHSCSPAFLPSRLYPKNRDTNRRCTYVWADQHADSPTSINYLGEKS